MDVAQRSPARKNCGGGCIVCTAYERVCYTDTRGEGFADARLVVTALVIAPVEVATLCHSSL